MMIAGSFPPLKCGVGDYTRSLAAALAELPGVNISVLTSTGEGAGTDPPNVDVRRLVPNWRLTQLGRVLKLVESAKPDVVHIQYPAAEYRGWLAITLPGVLRWRGYQVVQTWHEHYSECREVSLLNLLGCDALVHVRADFPERLPAWLRWLLRRTQLVFIPNASTIPGIDLASMDLENLKRQLSTDRRIVAFFGFANPNKGLEKLFEISDPQLHHLLLICDLHPGNRYHESILALIDSPEWRDHVTVSGFQPADRVAELLSVSDAAVFPFPGGGGDWNTSLQAASALGVFTLSTTTDSSRIGFDSVQNMYLSDPSDSGAMRIALNRYAGARVRPTDPRKTWNSIAQAHQRLYIALADERSP